ncbi:MAG: MBL fold metallo-hydrolase, partial [Actinomycetales bacterium]|nr:MBL fold metallo-hydrolase [Actinomycetales bacterium]
MLITRFGHSCVLVELEDARILIDPGIFSSQEAFRLKDLSAIVVTHQHPDHIDRTRIDVLAAM